MKKKQEIKQLDKLWKKMKSHIKGFLTSGDHEQLHQFRVQLKKIKALLTLYEAESANKNLLTKFKPVKKVFKKAGEIRNAYINLKLADEYCLDDPDFISQQQAMLDNSTKKFVKHGKKHLKAIKKAHIGLQNNIYKVSDKKVLQFYNDKIEEIAQFFDHLTYTDDLHNARKNIKLLLHNQNTAAKALADKAIFNADYLDDLQDKIGTWHDHVLAIETLSKQGEAENEAIESIKKSNAELAKKIADKSSNFRDKIRADMRKNVPKNHE